MHLLTLVMNEADAYAIESAFKPHADLSVTLLRLANSAAFGLQSPIGSVRQAVVMLGRRRLEAWLQLLMYTSGSGRAGVPLLQMASARGRFLELLSGVLRPGDPDYQDLAFMVGILSLMDSLIDVPMPILLEQINPVTPVREALMDRRGTLGTLLALAERLDGGDYVGVDALLHEMPMLRAALPAMTQGYAPSAWGIVLKLATGAVERFIPFPGWTLPGVFGAGGLQAMSKQGLDLAGKRVVIAGSGPLLLAVASHVAGRNAKVVAVAERGHGDLRRVAGPFLLGLQRRLHARTERAGEVRDHALAEVD